MKYKKPLNQIRAILTMDVALEQMKLEDGITVFEAESFEADYSVGIVTEEGIVPVPVGEYKLEDGSILVVEVEGVIKSIAAEQAEEAMPEEAAPAAEATEPQMDAQPKRIVESVSKESFFAEIEKFTTELAAVKAENEALKAENEALKQVALSADEPAVSPIVHNPESNEEKVGFRIGQRRAQTIQDSVFAKMYKN
jgi:hypothetical protein